MDDSTEMMDSAVCGLVRGAAKYVVSGNCAFIDDDISVLIHLAQIAVDGGLIDQLPPSIQKSIKNNNKGN